jgi:hypothetical protein
VYDANGKSAKIFVNCCSFRHFLKESLHRVIESRLSLAGETAFALLGVGGTMPLFIRLSETGDLKSRAFECKPPLSQISQPIRRSVCGNAKNPASYDDAALIERGVGLENLRVHHI